MVGGDGDVARGELRGDCAIRDADGGAVVQQKDVIDAGVRFLR